MEEGKEAYDCFSGKKCFIITQTNFKYHTSPLIVFNDSIMFTDNRGAKVMLAFSQIKFIQELNDN